MTAHVVDLHEHVGELLHAVGQRYTSGRRALVDVLSGAGRPLSIPEVLERRPALAQSSVYRNLTVLEQARVVCRVGGVDEFTRYELAEGLTGHHHHLVCTHCGSVTDVPASLRLERSLTRVVDQVAGEAGFDVRAHRLDLVGVCAGCR